MLRLTCMSYPYAAWAEIKREIMKILKRLWHSLPFSSSKYYLWKNEVAFQLQSITSAWNRFSQWDKMIKPSPPRVHLKAFEMVWNEHSCNGEIAHHFWNEGRRAWMEITIIPHWCCTAKRYRRKEQKSGEGGWDTSKALIGASVALTHCISKYPGTEVVVNS